MNLLEQIGNFILRLFGLRGSVPPVTTDSRGSDLGRSSPPLVGSGNDSPAIPTVPVFQTAPERAADPFIERTNIALEHGAPFGIAQILAGAALDHDLSVDMLARIAKIESSFKPLARNNSDRPPSVGLMGIKSSTAAAVMNWSLSRAEIEQRLEDPRTNVLVGSKTLNSIKANRGTARASERVLVEMYHLGETRYLKGERDPGYMGRYDAA